MSFFAAPLTRRALITTAAVAAPFLGTPSGSTPSADAAASRPPVSSFDQRLVRDINNARASRGLRRLALVAGTTDVAHRWSCHLARYHVLGHNPNLGSQLSSHGSAGWT